MFTPSITMRTPLRAGGSSPGAAAPPSVIRGTRPQLLVRRQVVVGVIGGGGPCMAQGGLLHLRLPAAGPGAAVLSLEVTNEDPPVPGVDPAGTSGARLLIDGVHMVYGEGLQAPLEALRPTRVEIAPASRRGGGPSGCGKSTDADRRRAAGCDGGEVRLDGRAPGGADRCRHRLPGHLLLDSARRGQRAAAGRHPAPADGAGAGAARELFDRLGLTRAAAPLPAPAFRRHAASASRSPARSSASDGAADGRAVRRARRADPRAGAGTTSSGSG